MRWMQNDTIRPVHKRGIPGNKTMFAGFETVFAERIGADRQLTLALHRSDMKRIGAILAHPFCHSLSGGPRYFEREAGTTSIEEAARAA
jgi:hypothetical protein